MSRAVGNGQSAVGISAMDSHFNSWNGQYVQAEDRFMGKQQTGFVNAHCPFPTANSPSFLVIEPIRHQMFPAEEDQQHCQQYREDFLPQVG